MDEPLWICPHCKHRRTEAASVATAFQRCGECQFIFPRLPLGASGSTWEAPAEVDGDDSLTRKWGSIRADRYRVIRALATGAQGKILLAHHRHLNQVCVIKLVDVTDDEWAQAAATRLRNEAQAGIRVNHQNVARVLDCDCVDGSWYFVMEYVEGENLRKIINEYSLLNWGQAVDIGIQAAEGLAAIHVAALVHRDIKPSNLILRGDGMVKIADLGLVKIRGGPAQLSVTQTGQMLGTPYYMPPEQFDAKADVDSRADIYSLGATLYHLLVGQPPHRGQGLLDISEKHRRDPVLWPDEAAQRTPVWLRHIVETCLAKRPEHRFESGSALAEALRAGADIRMSRRIMVPIGGRQEPSGVAVMSFANLTKRESDAWIGDAIAEYLTNRLMELEGLHIADAASFNKMLDHAGTAPATADRAQLVEAARLVGANTVVIGSYQRVGDQLRITAHGLNADASAPIHIANVSGSADELFELEDELATPVIELVGRTLEPTRRRHRGAEGTDSLDAHEKFIRGRRAFADGNYRGAIELAAHAIALDPDYLDPVGLIGACYARLGDYDHAVEYHQKQERLARQVHDQMRLAEALGNLGVMYYYKGEHALAYEFLEKACSLCIELKLPADTAKYYGNLGFALLRLNRLKDAEATFNEAIELNKRVGDLVSLVWPYNGMGTVLLKQQRYTEAREFYARALTLAEEIGDRVNVGVSHMNLGRCACLMCDFAEASMRFDAALRTLEGTDFWNGLTLVYEHMAEMHLQQNHVQDALVCIDRRIDLARRHHNNRMEAEAWQQKARAYEQMDDKDEALKCFKRSIEVASRPAPYESLHRYLEEVANRAPAN
ncbi:MAG TPA: tetratricopeptide repeat protein [Phycisphaerae bacterium]